MIAKKLIKIICLILLHILSSEMGNCMVKEEPTFTCQQVMEMYKKNKPVAEPECVQPSPVDENNCDCIYCHCTGCGGHRTRCTCHLKEKDEE